MIDQQNIQTLEIFLNSDGMSLLLKIVLIAIFSFLIKSLIKRIKIEFDEKGWKGIVDELAILLLLIGLFLYLFWFNGVVLLIVIIARIFLIIIPLALVSLYDLVSSIGS